MLLPPVATLLVPLTAFGQTVYVSSSGSDAKTSAQTKTVPTTRSPRTPFALVGSGQTNRLDAADPAGGPAAEHAPITHKSRDVGSPRPGEIPNSVDSLATRFARAGELNRVDVREYGAVADCATDNTAAFNAAEEAASASRSAVIEVPAGCYYVASSLQWRMSKPQSVALVGDGQRSTEVRFGGAGIAVTLSNALASFQASDLTISHSSAQDDTGLSVTADVAPLIGAQATFSNLVFQGAKANPADVWATALSLVNLASPTISDVFIRSRDDVTGNREAGIGIEIRGTSKSMFATNLEVVDTILQGGYAGLEVTGFVQGVNFVNGNILGGDYGILWKSGAANFAEQLMISNAQVAAALTDVLGENVNEVSLSSNLLLRIGTSPIAEWKAIDLRRQGYDTITGNIIIGNFSGRETGIRLLADRFATVTGNVVNGVHGIGIDLASGTGNVAVVSNSLANVSSGVVSSGVRASAMIANNDVGGASDDKRTDAAALTSCSGGQGPVMTGVALGEKTGGNMGQSQDIESGRGALAPKK